MKNLAIFGLMTCFLFSLSGCEKKSDYEDKDLTRTFIENNKIKLKLISEIKSIQVGSLVTNADIDTRVNEPFLSFINPMPYRNKNYIKDCNHILFINSNTVEFSKEDVIRYGKEYMYKEAQKCLDSVLLEIKNEEVEKEKIKKQIDENEALLKKRSEENLNKKFDEKKVQ
jgi:hypothetical protein